MMCVAMGGVDSYDFHALEVLQCMVERRRGFVVNVGSLGGKKTPPYDAVYGGTKAGLIEWTQGLRLELRGTGIHVSLVYPIYTDQVARAFEALAERDRAIVEAVESGAYAIDEDEALPADGD